MTILFIGFQYSLQLFIFNDQDLSFKKHVFNDSFNYLYLRITFILI